MDALVKQIQDLEREVNDNRHLAQKSADRAKALENELRAAREQSVQESRTILEMRGQLGAASTALKNKDRENNALTEELKLKRDKVTSLENELLASNKEKEMERIEFSKRVAELSSQILEIRSFHSLRSTKMSETHNSIGAEKTNE